MVIIYYCGNVPFPSAKAESKRISLRFTETGKKNIFESFLKEESSYFCHSIPLEKPSERSETSKAFTLEVSDLPETLKVNTGMLSGLPETSKVNTGRLSDFPETFKVNAGVLSEQSESFKTGKKQVIGKG